MSQYFLMYKKKDTTSDMEVVLIYFNPVDMLHKKCIQ